MQARIIKKFNNSDGFETTKNITIPLLALNAVNEATIEFLSVNGEYDPCGVFIRIGQPDYDKGTIEI